MNIPELEKMWADPQNTSIVDVLKKCLELCDNIGSGVFEEHARPTQQEIAGMLWNLIGNQLDELEE